MSRNDSNRFTACGDSKSCEGQGAQQPSRVVDGAVSIGLDRPGKQIGNKAVTSAAEQHGRELGTEQSGDLVEHLKRQGYEPYRDGDVLRLRNSPFHMVAREHVDLVCGMNLALMGGLVAALDRDDVDVQLEPAADRCCVAFAATG